MTDKCPVCGKDDKIIKQGFTHCKRKQQRYLCQWCGHKWVKKKFPRWNKQDIPCRPTACPLCAEKGRMWLHETVIEGQVYRFRCGNCGQVTRVVNNGNIDNDTVRSNKQST